MSNSPSEATKTRFLDCIPPLEAPFDVEPSRPAINSVDGRESDYERLDTNAIAEKGILEINGVPPRAVGTPVDRTPVDSSCAVARWSTEDVIAWLAHLGPAYGRLAGMIHELGVDGDLLLQVDERILTQELCVSSSLMRAKLLREIAKLKNGSGVVSTKASAAFSSLSSSSSSSISSSWNGYSRLHHESINNNPVWSCDSPSYSGDSIGVCSEAPVSPLHSSSPPSSSPSSSTLDQKHRRKSTSSLNDVPFQVIEFEELSIITKIGVGAYGSAYIAKWRGTMVVVKKLHREVGADFREIINELWVMEKVGRHPCVISLVGACLTAPNVCIVTEYAPRGSVHDTIITNKMLMNDADVRHLCQIAVDVSAGMIHLHSEGILHRDLACRNILLDNEFRARVGDFGRSRDLFASAEAKNTQNSNHLVGPVKWMAPEDLKHKEFTPASDVFMFGMTMWEMFARTPPYPDKDNLECAFEVVEGTLKPEQLPPQKCPPPVMDLIYKCTSRLPEDRPTMLEAHQTLQFVLRGLEPHPLDKLTKLKAKKKNKSAKKPSSSIRMSLRRASSKVKKVRNTVASDVSKFFTNIASCVSPPSIRPDAPPPNMTEMRSMSLEVGVEGKEAMPATVVQKLDRPASAQAQAAHCDHPSADEEVNK